MKDLSREVRGRSEREVPMETRVADITPVSSGAVSRVKHGIVGEGNGEWGDSQPNKSPLIPADTVSAHTNAPGLPSAAFPASAPPLSRDPSRRAISGASCE